MPRPFSPATAEQVVAVVEAASSHGSGTHTSFVAEFADLPETQAAAALELATDLALIKKDTAGMYAPNSPLCKLFRMKSESQRATALRVVLDEYRPFTCFRQSLMELKQPGEAARQTKALLDLSAHHDEIKDTLISLGTYGQVLVAEGGGKYRLANDPAENRLESLVAGLSELASARHYVEERIGASFVSGISAAEVIDPLALALVRAGNADPDGAVTEAGNAVESFLVEFALIPKVNLAQANGINAKAERLSQAHALPKKLLNVTKYLGHVRNAADHGIDSEIAKSWAISTGTGLEYVFVACSFVRAALSWQRLQRAEL